MSAYDEIEAGDLPSFWAFQAMPPQEAVVLLRFAILVALDRKDRVGERLSIVSTLARWFRHHRHVGEDLWLYAVTYGEGPSLCGDVDQRIASVFDVLETHGYACYNHAAVMLGCIRRARLDSLYRLFKLATFRETLPSDALFLYEPFPGDRGDTLTVLTHVVLKHWPGYRPLLVQPDASIFERMVRSVFVCVSEALRTTTLEFLLPYDPTYMLSEPVFALLQDMCRRLAWRHRAMVPFLAPAKELDFWEQNCPRMLKASRKYVGTALQELLVIYTTLDHARLQRWRVHGNTVLQARRAPQSSLYRIAEALDVVVNEGLKPPPMPDDMREIVLRMGMRMPDHDARPLWRYFLSS